MYSYIYKYILTVFWEVVSSLENGRTVNDADHHIQVSLYTRSSRSEDRTEDRGCRIPQSDVDNIQYYTRITHYSKLIKQQKIKESLNLISTDTLRIKQTAAVTCQSCCLIWFFFLDLVWIKYQVQAVIKNRNKILN